MAGLRCKCCAVNQRTRESARALIQSHLDRYVNQTLAGVGVTESVSALTREFPVVYLTSSISFRPRAAQFTLPTFTRSTDPLGKVMFVVAVSTSSVAPESWNPIPVVVNGVTLTQVTPFMLISIASPTVEQRR